MKTWVERLNGVKKVVTHANCPDGFASAAILRAAFGSCVPIAFMSYGTKELADLPAEPGLLFCDFTPPREREDEFFDEGTIVLDHHKSVEPLVRRYVDVGRGSYADEVHNPGVSGAVLAFRDVYVPVIESRGFDAERGPGVGPARDFATLAGIRDTWQKGDLRWRHACAQAEALKLYGERVLDLDLFDTPGVLSSFMTIGYTLLEKREASVRNTVREAWSGPPASMNGDSLRWVVVHKYDDVSDAAEAIGHDADLVVAYRYFANPDEPSRLKVNVSLRSRGDFDCGAFAKALGGGGHTKAAGFTKDVGAPIDTDPHGNFYEWFYDTLRAHLRFTREVPY